MSSSLTAHGSKPKAKTMYSELFIRVVKGIGLAIISLALM